MIVVDCTAALVLALVDVGFIIAVALVDVVAGVSDVFYWYCLFCC